VQAAQREKLGDSRGCGAGKVVGSQVDGGIETVSAKYPKLSNIQALLCTPTIGIHPKTH
jgi:hypothetical protein